MLHLIDSKMLLKYKRESQISFFFIGSSQFFLIFDCDKRTCFNVTENFRLPHLFELTNMFLNSNKYEYMLFE